MLASFAFCAGAQAELLVSRYAVSLGGVPMGEAVLHATIDAKHYKVEVSADVGSLLNNTKVKGEVTGSISGAKISPEHYKLVTSDGQESAIDFTPSAAAGGRANTALKGVLDPLSALLAASIRPAATTASPCDKAMTILMNRAKIDASLHPAEQIDPRVVSCKVHFAPANAEAKGAQLQQVQWDIHFQKLNKPQMWLVEQISLPSDLGAVTINRVETSVSGS